MSVTTPHLNRPDTFGDQGFLSRGSAILHVHATSASRVVVGASGEIDAANGRALGRYVERHTRGFQQLVVDLHAVDFCGSEGFRALYYLSVHCARTDMDWVVVASSAVRRLLAICDPNRDLPVADQIDCAHARLDHVQRCRYPDVVAN